MVAVLKPNDGTAHPVSKALIDKLCHADAEPMTRNALQALRNAGGLDKNCHYVITDYNRGTVGAATILMHAVDANTLAMDVSVKTAFDNVAWRGTYDIDTNRLLSLEDQSRNRVYDQDAVDAFPWGTANWYDNTIEDRGGFTYSGGVMNRSSVGANGSVAISGGFVQGSTVDSGQLSISGGRFDNSEINSASRVTVSDTADVQSSHFKAQSTLTASGSANIDNLMLDGSSQANISGGTLRANKVDTESTLNVSGGSVNENSLSSHASLTVEGGSVYRNELYSETTVTVPGGSFFENAVGSNSSVNLVGEQSFYRNTVENESALTVGPHVVIESTFSRCNLNTTGATGGGIRYQHMGRGVVFAQNVGTLYIQSGSFSGYYEIRATGAAEVSLNQVSMSSYGRVLVSTGARFQSAQSGYRDYGYAQVIKGFMRVNYSTAQGLAYFQNNTDGSNYVERTTVSNSSRVRFLGTSTNCRVYYSSAQDNSLIEHRGSSNNSYWYSCTATSQSEIYSENSVNLRGYYNSVSGNSRIYSRNMTGTHYIYYSVCSAHGYIHMENGAGGRIYAVHCSAQALVRFRPVNDASRLFYSSFHAYYYLYADNWTVTRFGLHGYGRRTYTVTNPPANGTFTQNF